MRLSRLPEPMKRTKAVANYLPIVRHELSLAILVEGPFICDRQEMNQAIERVKTRLSRTMEYLLFEQIMTQPEASPSLFTAIPREMLSTMRKIVCNEWPWILSDDPEEMGIDPAERRQLVANLTAINHDTRMHG